MESPPEDPQYLKEYIKDYIKEHPNNKMAWYLLGRQYAAKGEKGKANYCFAQAGEVYRAFEEGTVFGTSQGKEEQQSGEANKRRTKPRYASLWKTAVILLLLLLGSHIPLQSELPTTRAAGTIASEVDLMDDESGTAAQADLSSGRFEVMYTASVQRGAATDRADQIGQLLSRFQAKPRTESLLLAESEWSAVAGRRWLLWSAPAKPLVSVERSDTVAGTRLTYYDAQTCRCEPAEAAEPLARYAGWQNVQLQQLVVRSAVSAYEELNGNAPDGIEQLARNYPDNWLAGYTPAMKAYFEQWVGERQADGGANAGGNRPVSGGSDSEPRVTPALLSPEEALREPLRIIVDKATHTLALVSGNVLLRSYPVGLGGERTPEGEFTITEKVRNPNGRDNGAFGSRGMTLSDTLYAIHGTDQPSTVGKDKSLGCIRMLKPDVEELFDMVPKGTKVEIGTGLFIPAETYRADTAWRLPAVADETNPHKTYKWLD